MHFLLFEKLLASDNDIKLSTTSSAAMWIQYMKLRTRMFTLSIFLPYGLGAVSRRVPRHQRHLTARCGTTLILSGPRTRSFLLISIQALSRYSLPERGHFIGKAHWTLLMEQLLTLWQSKPQIGVCVATR